MELTQYLRLVRKWLWLIILAAILAGGVAFIVRSGQSSMYEAQTTVAIGHFINAPNPDSSQILTGISLAQTYAELVTTHDILQNVIDTLSLNLSVIDLRKKVDTQILTGTSLLVIKAQFDDPVVAADIANALAEQLIAKSPSNLTPDQVNQIKLANQQIEALNAQIARARLHIDTLDKQLASTTEPSAAATLMAQEDDITAQINQAAATIAQFTSTIASLQQRTNSLDIVERAQVPLQPTGVSVTMVTILAAILGAGGAVGFAVLADYLDTAIRTAERATQLLDLPVWGTIARFGKKKDLYAKRLITSDRAPNVVAESYRTLRTNLIFAHEKMNKVYVVTSPGPFEGKSLTAANLAISLAQSGLRVLLIDGDLRRPRVHEIFGVPNDVGLTTLLFADPAKLNQILANGSVGENGATPIKALKNSVRKTSVANLQVIPCGFIPPNPSELLGSVPMKQWVDAFRASELVDIIIIDTPPSVLVSDASLLAANVEAQVVLVLDASKTQVNAAIKTKEQFEKVGVPISGIVLNRVHPRDEDYGYGFGYGYYYETPDIQTPAAQNGRSKTGIPAKQK